MTGRKWYEWLLALVYLGMILVFIWLNFLSGEFPGWGSLLVNIAMFAVVGVIFLSCEARAFVPADRMEKDLRRVTLQIRQDAANEAAYLWERYRQGGQQLFSDEGLQRRYQDFVRETERIARGGKVQYRCDLEGFISEDMTDEVMHRNLLNQVPGALTGLGILGTFIGLSLGLQSFATGSTAEITNSIAPLMGGIKVAFHTSIYGMVFSLVFNYVLKRKLEETESAIRAFLDAHRNYVLPDAEADGRNLLLDLEQRQIEAIDRLADTIADSLADGMEELLEPQFDRFDETLKHFAEGAEKNQLDALGVLVNAFIAEANKSLGNSFSQLSYTIDQTFKLQQENAAQMKRVLAGTAESSARYTTWLSEQEKLVRSLHDSVADMPASAEKTARALQETLRSFGTQYQEMIRELEKMTEQVPYTYSAAYDGVRSAVDDVRDAVDDVHRAIERLNDSLVETIDRIDVSGKPVKEKERGTIFGKK